MKIVWADPAQFDLENIRDYISKDSEFYASNFVDEIFEAVENLQEFPEMGRNVPEADDPDIREIFLYSYRIMYRVEIERIVILAVVHGARDIGHDKIKPWDIA